MKPKSTIFVAALGALILGLAPAASQAQSVKEIFDKVDAAGRTDTMEAQMTQTVLTPSGDKRSFTMMSYSMAGTEKGLTEYLSPNQVRGMKILTLNDGDDIWTYFPRTNRTRKIASSARNRKVQGSDFTYDDMASGKLAKNWKGSVDGIEQLGGESCFKLSVQPTKSGPQSYSKATVWVDKTRWTVLRIEYFDLDGDKIKRLDISDYRTISGVLIPFKYTMTNLLDGGSTEMTVQEAKVNIDLKPGLFTEASLGN